MFKKTLMLLISILAINSNYPAGTPKPHSTIPEEYAVYSAAIEHKLVRGKTRLVVIQDRTQAYDYGGQPEDEHHKGVLEELSPVSESTLKDFVDKNREPRKLSGQFEIKAPYKILAKEEIESFFKGSADGAGSLLKGWEEFYKKYPESYGYVVLSRVGFDAEKRQAMVYVSRYCGGLCGDGAYILLTKDEGRWKVKNELRLWVS